MWLCVHRQADAMGLKRFTPYGWAHVGMCLCLFVLCLDPLGAILMQLLGAAVIHACMHNDSVSYDLHFAVCVSPFYCPSRKVDIYSCVAVGSHTPRSWLVCPVYTAPAIT